MQPANTSIAARMRIAWLAGVAVLLVASTPIAQVAGDVALPAA